MKPDNRSPVTNATSCFSVRRACALTARCPRCRARVSGAAHGRRSLDRLCALTLAALLTCCIAQAFPIVALDAAGIATRATLGDAVLALWSNGQPVVAVLVFCTTMLFPLMELAAWLYLLVPLRAGRVPRRFAAVLLGTRLLQPWSMVEVLMLGVLITIVKMTSLAHVLAGRAVRVRRAYRDARHAVVDRPGPPVGSARRTRRAAAGQRCAHDTARPDMTHHAAPRLAEGPTRMTARAAGLVTCHHCARVQPAHASDPRCTRCGSRLHARRPHSAARTGALAAAAALLYVPANLLPVMHATSLGRAEDDTILGGVAYFWTSGDWALAVIVFIASVLVPMLKLAILALQAIAAHRGVQWRPLERARLHRLVERVGRWSMLDVFVVALTIALVHFGSFADITPGPGALAFGAVVVLTMVASMQFDPRLIWDGAPRPATGRRQP